MFFLGEEKREREREKGEERREKREEREKGEKREGRKKKGKMTSESDRTGKPKNILERIPSSKSVLISFKLDV